MFLYLRTLVFFADNKTNTFVSLNNHIEQLTRSLACVEVTRKSDSRGTVDVRQT